MAKKIVFKSSNKADDFDLDAFLNSPDLVSDLDFGSSNSSKKPRRFEPIKKGIINGVKDTLKSPAFYKNTAKAILPKSYGETLDQASELTSQLAKVYSDSINEVRPSIRQLARQIDRMVPEERKSLKAFTDKIKKLTGADVDSATSSYSPERAREQNIESNLASIFGLQAEQQAKERASDQADKIINRQVDLKRFNISTRILANIGTGIDRLNAYNDSVNRAYQKKSLELQIRSLFVQTDSLALARTALETTGRQQNEIIRLLSLTEQEKIETASRTKSFKANKFNNPYRDGLFSKRLFIRNATDNIKNAVKSKVGDFRYQLERAFFGLENYAENAEMLKENGIDRKEIGANILTSLLFGTGVEALAKKYKSKILKPGSKTDNKLADIFLALKDPNALIDKATNSKYLKENIEKYGTVKENLKEKFRDLFNNFRPGNPLGNLGRKNLSVGELSAPAIFTNKTQRSITDVIPGYLARILREIQVFRTGNENIGLTEYNNIYGRFMSAKRSDGATKAYIRKELSSVGFDFAQQQALKGIAGSANLSPRAQRALADRIRDVATDPKQSMQTGNLFSEAFVNGLPADLQKELKPVIDQYGVGNDMRGRNQTQAMRYLESVRNSVGDKRTLLDDMANNPELLRVLKSSGIVSGTALKDVRINFKNYIGAATSKRKISEEDILEDLKANFYFQDALKKGVIVREMSGEYKVNRSKYEDFLKGNIKLKKIEYDVPKKKINPEIDPGLGSRNTSDFYAKKNIRPLPGKKILEGIKNTKVFSWMYKQGRGDGDSHIGPMAQELNKNLGEHVAPNGKSIDQISLNGSLIGSIGQLSKEVDEVKRSRGKSEKTDESLLLLHIAANTDRMVELLLNNITIQANGQGVDVSALSSKIRTGFGRFKQAVLPLAKRFGTNLFATAKDTYRYLRGTVRPSLKAGLAFGIDAFKNLLNPIKDIYSATDLKKPLLTVKDIEAGQYIDKLTGKVISTLSDITGPVIDRAGNIVVSADDIRRGLVDAAGKSIKNFSDKLKLRANQAIRLLSTSLTMTLPAGIRQLVKMGKAIRNFAINSANTVVDVYKKDDFNKPLLYAKDILDGKYIDVKSGKVIYTLGDITGPVVDQKGAYIVTEDDYQAGLVDIHNRPIASLSKKLTNLALSGIGFAKTMATGAIKRISEMAKNFGKDRFNLPSFGFGRDDKILEVLKDIRDILRQQNDMSNSNGGGSDDNQINNPTDSNSVAKGGFRTIKSSLGFAKDKLNQIRDNKDVILERLRKPAEKITERARKPLGRLSNFAKKIPGFGLATKGFGFLKNKVGGLFGKNSAKSDQTTEALSSNQADGNKIEDQETDRQQQSSLSGGVRSLKIKASDNYQRIRTSLLSKRRFGTGMDEINARQKELEETRRANNAVAAQASLDPKYTGQSNLFKNILGGLSSIGDMFGNIFQKVKGIKDAFGAFKGMKSLADFGKKGLSVLKGAGRGLGLLRAAGTAASLATSAGAVSGLAGGAATAATAGAVTSAATAATAAGVTGAGGAMAVGAVNAWNPVGWTILGAAAVAAVGYGLYKGFKFITRDKVDPVGQLRMTQYGLTPDLHNYNHYFLTLEEYFSEHVIKDASGKPTLDNRLDPKQILKILDIDKGDTALVESANTFINQRFIPVFLANTAALWTANSKYNINELSRLSTDQLLTYIKSASFLTGPYNVTVSPFKYLGKLPAGREWVQTIYDKALAHVNKKAGVKDTQIKDTKPEAIAEKSKRETVAKDATSTDTDKSDRDSKPLNAASGPINLPANKTLSLPQRAPEITKADMPVMNDGNPRLMPIPNVPGRSISVPESQSPGPGGNLPSSNLQNGNSAPTKERFSPADIKPVSKEAATKISTVPSVSERSPISDVKNMIGQIAAAIGVNPVLAQAMAAKESSFKPFIKAGTSSATGLFQFIKSTWNNMIRKYGANFGFGLDTPPTDPKANATMGALYLKDNIANISKIRKDVTPTDVYLAHFLGPAGAAQVIKNLETYPNAIAAQMLPQPAAANKTLFYQGGNLSQPFTLSQFYDNFKNSFYKLASKYGLSLDSIKSVTDTSGAALSSPSSSGQNSPSAGSGSGAGETGSSTAAKIASDAGKSSLPGQGSLPSIAGNRSMPSVTPGPIGPRPDIAATSPAASSENIASTGPLGTPSTPAFNAIPVVPKETAQGPHYDKLHTAMGGVSEILTKSFDVQQKMLEKLGMIANNTAKGTSPSTNPDATKPVYTGNAVSGNTVPRPAINLDRTA